ncbi:MAG: hypothetical protein U9R50_06135 [Campylobacterota bacterium]|nr:hypothetical protein [Campylobacterota bacterium]
MSQPHVSLFSDIVIEASRVKRGSLFVALNFHDITLAIQNGAYGIVYDRDMEFDDDENAWIKVDDSYDALKRLMRFMLIDKELVAFTCKPIVLQVAKQLTTSNDFIILEGSLSDNFSKLLSAPPQSTLLFVESEIQSSLFTDASILPDEAKDKIKTLEHTLFEMAFIYKDTYYERQSISPFFIPYLEQILALLNTQDISFKIKPFHNMPHFQAKFVNKALHVRDFGSTNKVIIFENNRSLIEEQMIFISKQAPWAKCIQLVRDKREDEEEILNILKTDDFNFALLSGVEATFLDNKSNFLIQQTLF